ncbi:hypothetical protein [Haloferax gibbonsii]|nr:hypothetical protein [Haloferax gibbonsii]
MAIGGTTVGPVEEKIRDRLKDLRDREGHPNYNETLRALLDERETTECES